MLIIFTFNQFKFHIILCIQIDLDWKMKTTKDELWNGTFNERSWHEIQCLNCKSSVQEHVYYKFKSLYLPLVFRYCLFQNK